MDDEAAAQPLIGKHRDPAFPWWFRSLFGSMAVAVFAAGALRRPISDPDTFWHIRAGQWLPTTWQFSGLEPWSQSSTRPWILHEWLPELLIARVEASNGLTGVAWLYAVSVALVGLCLYAACRRRAFMMLAGLVVGLTLVAMSGSLTPRPHLVTFALTALFVDTWMRSLQDGRPRWWLVLAAWLWACSHGMWFLGPVVGLLAVLGGSLDRSLPWRHLGTLAGVATASAAVGAFTPIGPRLLLAPFHVSEYTEFVAEWQPAPLTSPQMIAFMIMTGAVVAVWSRRRIRVPWTEILMLAVGVGLALLYARTVAVGAAVVAPIAAATVQSIVPLRREAGTLREGAVVVGFTATALLGVSMLSPGRLGEQSLGPENLSGALERLPEGTVVCNDYGLGGWLLWRHPSLHPVIDGRAEVYAVDHLERHADFLQGAPGWEDFVRDNNCAAMLIADDEPVIEDLTGAGWLSVHSDDGHALLVRE